MPDVAIAYFDLVGADVYPRDAVPVPAGHDRLTGTPTPLAANVACTNDSVTQGGKLAAYRWDVESVLSPDNFQWVGKGDADA